MPQLSLAVGRGAGIFPGARKTVSIPAPAVATVGSVTVPGGEAWNIVYATYVLTTDVNVANRFAGWEIRDPDGNILYAAVEGFGITASQASRLSATSRGRDVSTTDAGLRTAVILPDFPILPGWS